MRSLLTGAVLSVLGAAGAHVDTGSGLTLILAIASSGGVLSLFIQKYLNRNRDDVGLSEKAMKMVRQSLEDVEVMRIEIARLSKRLSIVQKDLETANEQIAGLQQKLTTSNGDRERLKAQLDESVQARDGLQRQLSELRARMEGMEAVMKAGRGERGPAGPAGPQGLPGTST